MSNNKIIVIPHNLCQKGDYLEHPVFGNGIVNGIKRNGERLIFNCTFEDVIGEKLLHFNVKSNTGVRFIRPSTEVYEEVDKCG
jgi:hypothetical protein